MTTPSVNPPPLERLLFANRLRSGVLLVLFTGIAVAVLLRACDSAVAEAKEPEGRSDTSDDDFSQAAQEGHPAGNGTFRIVPWAFDFDLSEGTNRDRLVAFLQQRVSGINRFCKLNEVQRRKLQLAGKHDIKRALHEFDRAKQKFQLVQDDQAQVDKLDSEVRMLRRRLISKLMADESMFEKCLRTIITPEQMEGLDAYRAVLQAGGEIQTEPEGVFEVRLSRTEFADKDLVRMQGLTDLQRLFLDETQVSDAGIGHLSRLASLIEVSLSNTQITDGALTHLKWPTDLQWLSLTRTDISDGSLVPLGKAARLKGLRLSDTRITDAGLAHLLPLANLEKLDLSGTQITDAGLAQLKSLTNLRVVSLKRTKVTDAGVAELNRALPEVEFDR